MDIERREAQRKYRANFSPEKHAEIYAKRRLREATTPGAVERRSEQLKRARQKYQENPENRETIRKSVKRAKEKHRANMSPEKRQRERGRSNRAVQKYMDNLTPQKRAEVRQRQKQAGRKHRIKRYGLTYQQFDDMLAAQNGGCAICGRTDSGRKRTTENLHIDHCHKTRKVRGLLCDNCNNGLGRFSDDPTLLRKAIAYLKKHM